MTNSCLVPTTTYVGPRTYRRAMASDGLQPLLALKRTGACDPLPTPAALQSGRRNRLKPPFNLRQRGASTFSQIGRPQEATARGPPLREAVSAEHGPTADPQSRPSRPSSSTSASAGSHHRHRLLTRVRCRAGACLPPPACPRAATLASAPARRCHHKRAEQLVATANRRLTRATGSSAPRPARLKWVTVPTSCRLAWAIQSPCPRAWRRPRRTACRCARRRPPPAPSRCRPGYSPYTRAP